MRKIRSVPEADARELNLAIPLIIFTSLVKAKIVMIRGDDNQRLLRTSGHFPFSVPREGKVFCALAR